MCTFARLTITGYRFDKYEISHLITLSNGFEFTYLSWVAQHSVLYLVSFLYLINRHLFFAAVYLRIRRISSVVLPARFNHAKLR
jgi:hypothetical protein